MRDTLPNKIKKQECGIVNMDSDKGSGPHWIAYIKHLYDVVYFDSYGNLPPPIEVVEYFQSHGTNVNITYNYDVVQKFNSDGKTSVVNTEFHFEHL